ncbi:uncharacterized protein LOC143878921 [Tasmannia lanceolata]|uniref:uncharacterized protein LOC143878921 n=1 Tax=Tasmannia lanceolata TaxID=3420 RepID=UPI004063BB4F
MVEFGFITAVYGFNKSHERNQLWNELISLSQTINNPWIALGDFNATKFADERIGGAPPVLADLRDFNHCIDCCSLSDLRSIGQSLSWNNSAKSSEPKWRRLDRALVNIDWLCQFPYSFAEYKPPGLSDHSPLVVQIYPIPSLGGKPLDS